LLYSSELDFVDKLRSLVDREGILNVKSRLDKVVKWIKVLFTDDAEDYYKAKWLAEIADEISKDPNLEGLAVRLGEFVEDSTILRIAHKILKRVEKLDKSVKNKITEFLEVLDKKYAKVVLNDLAYMLENWHPYYLEVLDESIKSKGKFLPRKVSYYSVPGCYRVYVPEGWGAVVGGTRYVVFKIPGVGEEVSRVYEGWQADVSKLVMDVLEDYKRSVVLVSPGVYNAGFIGVVSSEARFSVPDDYFAFLKGLDDEWLRGVGAGGYVVAVFEQDGKSVKAVRLLDARQRRLSVGFLKDRGFKIEEGALIYVRIVAVFDFKYLFEKFKLKRFKLEDRYSLEVVGLGEGYLRVKVVDWRGDQFMFIDYTEIGFFDKYGIVFAMLGDGNKLALFFDPEASVNPLQLKFAKTRSDGGFRYVEVEKCAVVEYGDLGKVLSLLYKARRYNIEYLAPLGAYYQVYEGGIHVFKPVESVWDRVRIYFMSMGDRGKFMGEDLTDQFKEEIKKFVKKEGPSSKTAEMYNRMHFAEFLRISNGYSKRQVFTHKGDVKILSEIGERGVDVLVLRSGEGVLTVVEMKCIFIASDEVFSNRVAYGRERARKQLISLKKWLLQSGYVDKNTKRLTSKGAEAIIDYMRRGGAGETDLWSVSELEGLKLEFWIVIADSRAVIEDPKNDIYYIWVDVEGVTGVWED